MFTVDKEVPLFEVFENIAKNNDYKEAISHKSSDEVLKEFMTASLPDYDTERVYASDIKKLAQWYNILQKAGYITPESFVKAEPETLDGAQEEISIEKEAPKKAPKAEKPAAPKVKATSAAKAAPKSTHTKKG
jgi:hypothetical protein